MAQHPCPSCGYQHESSGNEVPAIEVVETRAPTLDEVGAFLQNVTGRFGLNMDSSVRQVVDALRGDKQHRDGESAEPAAPRLASCPLCQAAGVPFKTANRDEYKRHMAAGKHPAEAEPEPEPEPAPPSTPVNEPAEPPAPAGEGG